MGKKAASIVNDAIDMPTVEAGKIWHVGDMLTSSKRRNSYEGAGLSVSRHPAAWRMISRGMVHGDTWKLKKKQAKLLDARALDERQTAIIVAWGIREGLLERRQIWRWTSWDDEIEEETHQHFGTFEDALEEAEMADEDEDSICEVEGYASTSRLDEITLQDRPTIGTRSPIDLLLPLYADQALGIDGVWWEDALDPLCHSAPRGVIHSNRLSLWKVTRCSKDPDHDEY